MRLLALLLTALLAACNGNSNNSPPPLPQGQGWVSAPGWEFYNGSPAEPHYVVKLSPPLTDKIVLSYSVTGGGPLRALDGGSPPTVSLIIWRSGDNLSCQGEYQQYRYFSRQRGSLSPGDYTLTVNIDPSNWTDCYGKPGTDFPARFQATIYNVWKIGFTFGGNSAGHGVIAPQGGVQFTLKGFSP